MPDQIAFAAVVYFGQVFGFCRLINKSVLKWFALMCLNNAYYDKIYPFWQKPSHIAFDQEETMPPEIYYQKISQYSQENRSWSRPATLEKRL